MAGSSSGYAGIQTYLRGRFRTLDGPDDAPHAPLFALPSAITREQFAAASDLPESMTKFLIQLDTKIDAILAGLHASSLERDFPHAMEISLLSANGFDFSAPEPLAPGDWLEAVIFFGGLAPASGIGRVSARHTDKNGAPVFSFAFSRIYEEEREKIIRYVFKEERRLLRETRLE